MSHGDWYTSHVRACIGRYAEKVPGGPIRWYSYVQRTGLHDARGVLGVLLVGLTNHRNQGGFVPLLEHGDTIPQCQRVARMFCEAAVVPPPWPSLRWLARRDTQLQALAMCLRHTRLPLELQLHVFDFAKVYT